MKIRRYPPTSPINVDIVRYQVDIPDAEPRNILEEIVWYKEKEVTKRRDSLPLLKLRQQLTEVAPAKNFLQGLRESANSPALIAEVKKASPSKGLIRADFDPVAIARAYQQAGAACISVLTDRKFFQGSFENLGLVRQAVDLPILCKEFIIYPYQIYLARSYGADAVLLIAAILTDQDLQYFVKITRAVGMTPLIEVHTLSELDRVLALDGVNLVGINNRNLEDFSVSLQTTCQLLQKRRDALRNKKITVVSESGIHTSADLTLVGKAGAEAVLVGESLLKQQDLQQAITGLFSTP